MRHLLLSGTGVESPDTESKERAAQRGAGVAIRGARGTPGHTNVRARRTNAGADLGARAARHCTSVSCHVGASQTHETLMLPIVVIPSWSRRRSTEAATAWVYRPACE